MVGMAVIDAVCAVKLLAQHYSGELVREVFADPGSTSCVHGCELPLENPRLLPMQKLTSRNPSDSQPLSISAQSRVRRDFPVSSRRTRIPRESSEGLSLSSRIAPSFS